MKTAPEYLEEIAQLKSKIGGKCEWKSIEDMYGAPIYETECDKAFEFIAGARDDDFAYCPYCSKLIWEGNNAARNIKQD